MYCHFNTLVVIVDKSNRNLESVSLHKRLWNFELGILRLAGVDHLLLHTIASFVGEDTHSHFELRHLVVQSELLRELEFTSTFEDFLARKIC